MRSSSWAGSSQQVEIAKRAAVRIDTKPAKDFYGALVGFSGPDSAISFYENIFTIRPLEEAPEPLNCLLNVKHELLGAISHVPLDRLTHELVISRSWVKTIERAGSIAILIGNILRMRTGAVFSIPSVVDCPWDTLAGQEEGSRAAVVVDRELSPERMRSGDGQRLHTSDAEWISSNFDRVVETGQSDDRYTFALQCLGHADFDLDWRMSATRLWGGIEALFDVSQEIRFRLSAMLASLLHEPGARRVAAYGEVKKLYDNRSKIVHGRKIGSDVLKGHVREVRTLLCDCLVKVTEIGHVPTSRELEEIMLGRPVTDVAR